MSKMGVLEIGRTPRCHAPQSQTRPRSYKLSALASRKAQNAYGLCEVLYITVARAEGLSNDVPACWGSSRPLGSRSGWADMQWCSRAGHPSGTHTPLREIRINVS